MKIAIIGGTSFIGESLISFFKEKKIIATYNSNKIISDNKVKWKKLDFRDNKKNFFVYFACKNSFQGLFQIKKQKIFWLMIKIMKFLML